MRAVVLLGLSFMLAACGVDGAPRPPAATVNPEQNLVLSGSAELGMVHRK